MDLLRKDEVRSNDAGSPYPPAPRIRLTSSGRHLRIFLSEISSSEEINEMLHGRIGVMIRLLDLRWLRGSILGSVLEERVRQGAAHALVKQNEQRAGANALVGESIRVGPANALQ